MVAGNDHRDDDYGRGNEGDDALLPSRRQENSDINSKTQKRRLHCRLGAMYSALFRVHSHSNIQSLLKRKPRLFAVLDSHLSDSGTIANST